MNRKLITVLILAIAIISCSQQDEPIYVADSTATDIENLSPMRTPQDAADIANALMSQQRISGRNARIITASEAIAVTSQVHSRSEVDTIMYAVNFGDNEGFVLVSAPTDVEPILAVTEHGDFNSETSLKNEPFQAALSMAKNYVISTSSIGDLDPSIPPTFDSTRWILKPQGYSKTEKYDMKKFNLTVEWGQGWPENIYAPNKVAGCVPVAVTQILSFYEKPKLLKYNFPEKDCESENADWPSLKKHKRIYLTYEPHDLDIDYHCTSCEADLQTHIRLGRLVREIGYQCHATYHHTPPKKTSAPTSIAIALLKGILTESEFYFIVEQNARALIDSFYKTDCKGIAYVEGWTNDNEGHVWVADGAWVTGTIIKRYVYDPDGIIEYRLESVTDKVTRYLHFNWGYNGNSNGYFLENIYDLSKGSELDNPTYSQSDFNFYKNLSFYWICERN